jgi:hypothetical protein
MVEFWFFIEVLVGGLLSGIMYSFVALGFVLIYKVSSVFNFAQGSMVFFAVLSFVGFMELGLPFWAALPAAVGLMVLQVPQLERPILRARNRELALYWGLAVLLLRGHAGRQTCRRRRRRRSDPRTQDPALSPRRGKNSCRVLYYCDQRIMIGDAAARARALVRVENAAHCREPRSLCGRAHQTNPTNL